MSRRTQSLLLFGILLLGLSAPAHAQLAISDEEEGAQRTARIVENLKFRIPQLRDAFVVVGEITGTDIDGLETGSLTINGQQNIQFLITSDDATLYLLGSDPVNISLSSADIAEAMEEERLVAERQRVGRFDALNIFAADAPVRGNPNAPVTIVEFSDFQCPYCSRAFETVEQVLERYPNDVRFIYLHFPLNNHPWALPSAIASVCAANQSDDAFWMLHDGYFRNQDSINPTNVLERSRAFLATSDVDLEAWSSCASDPQSAEYIAASEAVQVSLETGDSFGVSGTPGFFINGHFLNGALPMATFEGLINEILQNAGQ